MRSHILAVVAVFAAAVSSLEDVGRNCDIQEIQGAKFLTCGRQPCTPKKDARVDPIQSIQTTSVLSCLKNCAYIQKDIFRLLLFFMS